LVGLPSPSSTDVGYVLGKWLGKEAAAARSEDGIIVASPWHTDHFHVRFREEGRVGFGPR